MKQEPTPYSFVWNEVATPEARAMALIQSMAAAKCKNKYPKGVIGAEARAHYTEARRIVMILAEIKPETGKPMENRP